MDLPRGNAKLYRFTLWLFTSKSHSGFTTLKLDTNDLSFSNPELKGTFLCWQKYWRQIWQFLLYAIIMILEIINYTSFKGQLILKKNVKPRILPKNEQMNSFLLVCNVFLSVFGIILGQKKMFRDYLTFRPQHFFSKKYD